MIYIKNRGCRREHALKALRVEVRKDMREEAN